MRSASEIRFDGWTLKCDSGELTRGGRTIRLQTQPQQVLEALLERAGEMVSREQLIARLWPKGIVDFDTALNSAVRRLRSALGDDADAPRYIETLPRRGYRFIGALACDAPHAAAAAPAFVPRSASQRGQHRALAALAAALSLALTGSVAMHFAGKSVSPALAMSLRQPSHIQANSDAAENYGLARFFLQRRLPGDLRRAREHFDEAIARDPGFARAYSGLASTYWLLTVEGFMPSDAGMAEVRASAERALAFDPDLTEAHVRLAYYYERSVGNKRLRDEHLRRAIETEPDNALLLSEASSAALEQGRAEDGLQLARRAVAAEPLSPIYRYNLADTLLRTGRFDEARRTNLDVLEIDPNYPHTEIAAQALILEGRFDEALKLAESWPDGAEKWEVRALAYHCLHRAADADAALALLIAVARDSDPLRIVEVYAYRDEPENAFAWLGTATKWLIEGNLPHSSCSLLPWALRLSPFTLSLRGDPRWLDWVAHSRNAKAAQRVRHATLASRAAGCESRRQ